MTDPAMISAAVKELLSGTDHEDSFVVHRLAKDLAVGIADERARKDGDMVRVIRVLSAALEPMIVWLKRDGFDAIVAAYEVERDSSEAHKYYAISFSSQRRR